MGWLTLILVSLAVTDFSNGDKSRFREINLPRGGPDPNTYTQVPSSSRGPSRASPPSSPRSSRPLERLRELVSDDPQPRYNSRSEVFSDISKLRSFLDDVKAESAEQPRGFSSRPSEPRASSPPKRKVTFFNSGAPAGATRVDASDEPRRQPSRASASRGPASEPSFSSFPPSSNGESRFASRPEPRARPTADFEPRARQASDYESPRSFSEPSRPVARPPPAAPRPTPKPAPKVQGFRVKGDYSNRIVFLDVAQLDFDPSSGVLHLGDSELIPVDELEASSPVRGPSQERPRPQIPRPEFSPRQQDARPRAEVPLRQDFPQSRPQFDRFQSSQRQNVVLEQPSQFFQKFDDQRSGSRQQQPVQLDQRQSFDAPRQQQTSFRGNNDEFSSFPVRANQQQQSYDLPERQQQPVRQPYELPRQSRQQTYDLPQQSRQQTYDLPQQTRQQSYDLPEVNQQQRLQEPLGQKSDGYDVYLRGVLEQNRQIEAARNLQQRVGDLNQRVEQDRIARLPPQQRREYQNLQRQQYEQPQQFQQQQYQQPQKFQQQQPQQFQQQQYQQPQQQFQQPHEVPKVPGVEKVLQAQAQLRAVEQQHNAQFKSQSPEQFNRQQQQQYQQPQQQQYQQPQQQQYQQPQPFQQPQQQFQQPQSQPKVPGLEIVQQQRQALLAIELNHNAQQPTLQQQPVPQFQPAQQQPAPQFQPAQHQSQPNAIPGLSQHAQYVAQLQAAQTALGALQG